MGIDIMNKKGVASIIVTIFVMLMLAVFVATVSSMVATDAYIATNHLDSIKAFYIASAGLARARVLLATEWQFDEDHSETDVAVGDGIFDIATNYVRRDNVVSITATGFIPNKTALRAKRTITETNVPPPTRTNLSLPASVTASASSSEAGHEPIYSKDGDYNTYWQSQRVAADSWLSFTFPTSLDFDKIIIYQRWVNLLDFSIQYLSGTNWVDVPNPQISGTNTKTIRFDKVTSTGIRIYIRSVSGTENPNITEFETYLGIESLGKGKFNETY